jgi:hypothetical protein
MYSPSNQSIDPSSFSTKAQWAQRLAILEQLAELAKLEKQLQEMQSSIEREDV